MTINFDEYDKRIYKKFLSNYIDEKSLNFLEGILKGIIIDDVVNFEEVKNLKCWLDSNTTLKEIKPYDSLFKRLESIIKDGAIDSEEIEDIKHIFSILFLENETDVLVTAGIRRLHGVFKGLLIDNELNDVELQKLYLWISENDFLKGSYPYDEIETLLTHVLSDKRITEEERILIESFIEQFTSQEREGSNNNESWETLKNKYSISAICCTDPKITIEGSTFSFTGESNRKTRSQIAEIIECFGGRFHDSITKKVNYLIVGAKGNDCWAFTAYGRKIEKALELRKKGLALQIVHENDFWDLLS